MSKQEVDWNTNKYQLVNYELSIQDIWKQIIQNYQILQCA